MLSTVEIDGRAKPESRESNRQCTCMADTTQGFAVLTGRNVLQRKYTASLAVRVSFSSRAETSVNVDSICIPARINGRQDCFEDFVSLGPTVIPRVPPATCPMYQMYLAPASVQVRKNRLLEYR